MANVGLVTLGSLRIQAQQRADMVNSLFCTTPEFNQYITSSYKELYDLLVTSYGDEYFIAAPYAFTTSTSTQLYALPDGSTTVDAVTSLVAVPFYKLVGVDLKITSSPDSWITLRRFEFTERNKFFLANQYALYGIVALRYRVMGSNLWLTPIPVGTQTLQLWYVPKPTNLQATVSCGFTSSSTTVTCTDTTQLAVGMNVADLILPQGTTQVVQDGTTISSIIANTSFVMSLSANSTKANYLVAAWSDLTTLDGISGWEEYVVIDAAMKALIKEQNPNVQELMVEKEALKTRIIETAANRDASLPARVTDTSSIDISWPGGFGDGSRW